MLYYFRLLFQILEQLLLQGEPTAGSWEISNAMRKSYHGVCFRCKRYGEVTFRSTKSVVDEETGEKKQGKRFMICLECLN